MITAGQFVDLFERRIYPANIHISDGRIVKIEEVSEAPSRYILPGFIDAHIHIESSMLTPSAFARIAATHGTVATVSDPHEIANVCGIEGVEYMIADSKRTPFKIFFGAPSCVPATNFETAGAVIDSVAVDKLLQSDDIWYLSEMMNYPGVLFDDGEVMAKIRAAKRTGKPIDGHAPGLKGNDVIKYAGAGISTDHECFTIEEALEKLAVGMHILIREGSATKNYDALAPLLKSHPEKVMFCSDDKHPDELVLGHINLLVRRAMSQGYDLFNVLRAACVNPVLHYSLPVGLLRIGDAADFIVVESLTSLNVLETWIDGTMVAKSGVSTMNITTPKAINNFNTNNKRVEEFVIKAPANDCKIRAIEAIEGQLVTNEIVVDGRVRNGFLISDTENDILKMAVVNRYSPDKPTALAFIKNFGLKEGAIASTVGHDCHNIIVIGVDDESLCAAVNELIKTKGGISVAKDPGAVSCMPLPIAGLMSPEEGQIVAENYTKIDKLAKELGTKLHAPFMTLSFMALLVIPALKLSDKGLFDGTKFEFTDVVV